MYCGKLAFYHFDCGYGSDESVAWAANRLGSLQMSFCTAITVRSCTFTALLVQLMILHTLYYSKTGFTPLVKYKQGSAAIEYAQKFKYLH